MVALALSAEGAGKLSSWVSHHFVEAASVSSHLSLDPSPKQVRIPAVLFKGLPAEAQGPHGALRNPRELLAAWLLGSLSHAKAEQPPTPVKQAWPPPPFPQLALLLGILENFWNSGG